ncbi:MAG: fused MFS/spermidine synthase [Clostridia bacterium]|nr:fused MFS/spermidine synthase [Clostridia bacterium]
MSTPQDKSEDKTINMIITPPASDVDTDVNLEINAIKRRRRLPTSADGNLPDGKIIKSKVFLYLTAFFSGMSVMAVELAASRQLAPYFSSSQIVWTVIIGTIMIALAIGNVWGGRLADRRPHAKYVFIRLLIASIWISALAFVGRYIIAGITAVFALIVTRNFLIWASVASCILLYVFPLILLGTISPALIKLSVNNLAENGRRVGELEALNTVGSILGTFLPTFVTIPAFGTATTFLIFGAILCALSLAYFISARIWLIRSAVSLLLIVCLTFLPFSYSFAFWENNLIYEGESIYNYLQVKEDDYEVTFSTNVAFGVQSVKSKTDYVANDYYTHAFASCYMAGFEPMTLNEVNSNVGSTSSRNGDKRFLVLGLCMGTVCSMVEKYFGGVQQEGVEVDSKIVDLAYQYFDLSDNVNAIVADGRAYLQYNNDTMYDIIFVDAFQDITIPFYMCTEEFFTLCKQHLNTDGVLCLNLNMYSDQPSNINDYIIGTVRKVFNTRVWISHTNGTNAVIYVSPTDVDIDTILSSSVASLPNAYPVKARMMHIANNMSVATNGQGLLLTDDNSPTELLGSRVIDDMIQSQLSIYRRILREKGIRGLLDYLK